MLCISQMPWPPKPFTIRTLSRLFELALGLSAWKPGRGVGVGPSRNNPSSGNLHPTEGMCFPAGRWFRSAPGLYHHYAAKEHGLELRADSTARSHSCSPFPPGAFCSASVPSIGGKPGSYGERAFRYCNHDVGHALGSARLAAHAWLERWCCWMGWIKTRSRRFLGTPVASGTSARTEPEHP